MIDLGKKAILGVQIDAVDYEAALSRLLHCARSRTRYAATALAVHGVMTGALDAEHRYRLNHLDMIVPDGMPVRWGLNWVYGCKLPDRVYGPNLMLMACESAAKESIPIYLFGSDSETLAKLAENLQHRFPDLRVAGCEASLFRTLTLEESTALAERINQSGAGLVFVGLGCPRQETWAYEMSPSIHMPILTVGAAFAFHAGAIGQAPSWMQRSGLEWVFRFITEPKRLWKRYVYLNPAYLFMLGLQYLRVRSVDPQSGIPPTTRKLYG